MSAPSPLRVLFIKPKLIGDTLLLTPTLEAVRRRHPGATIDLVIRRGSESILAGCSAHNRVFLTEAPDSDRAKRGWRTQWQLVRELRATRYDWIFECSDTARGRYLAWAARGWRKVCNRHDIDVYGRLFDRVVWPAVFTDTLNFDWRETHAVDGSYRLAQPFLDLPAQPPPLDFRKVTFDPGAAQIPVPAGFQLSPSRLIIHCGTRLASKAWPDERWVELVRALAPRFEQIFLSLGPSEAEAKLGAQLAALSPGRVFAPAGFLPWAQLAALLQGARLFLGVDTAAMHVAAACQCPSVVIWGPASAVVFGPQSPHAAIVLGDRIVRAPFPASTGHDEERLGTRNSVGVVQRAAEQILAEGGR
jgi:heptosyltransferase-3